MSSIMIVALTLVSETLRVHPDFGPMNLFLCNFAVNTNSIVYHDWRAFTRENGIRENAEALGFEVFRDLYGTMYGNATPVQFKEIFRDIITVAKATAKYEEPIVEALTVAEEPVHVYKAYADRTYGTMYTFNRQLSYKQFCEWLAQNKPDAPKERHSDCPFGDFTITVAGRLSANATSHVEKSDTNCFSAVWARITVSPFTD